MQMTLDEFERKHVQEGGAPFARNADGTVVEGPPIPMGVSASAVDPVTAPDILLVSAAAGIAGPIAAVIFCYLMLGSGAALLKGKGVSPVKRWAVIAASLGIMTGTSKVVGELFWPDGKVIEAVIIGLLTAAALAIIGAVIGAAIGMFRRETKARAQARHASEPSPTSGPTPTIIAQASTSALGRFAVSNPWLVFAAVSLVVLAIMTRYEMRPSASAVISYRLDRWTGQISRCGRAGCIPLVRTSIETSPTATSSHTTSGR